MRFAAMYSFRAGQQWGERRGTLGERVREGGKGGGVRWEWGVREEGKVWFLQCRETCATRELHTRKILTIYSSPPPPPPPPPLRPSLPFPPSSHCRT